MELHPLDGYLLDGTPTKDEAIAAVLRDRSSDPRAQPFYRALDALGVRAADEALLALRPVLAGRAPSDEAVVAVRAARSRAKTGAVGAREAYLALIGAD